MHEFTASKETLQDLKEGDRIEARLRQWRSRYAPGRPRAPGLEPPPSLPPSRATAAPESAVAGRPARGASDREG